MLILLYLFLALTCQNGNTYSIKQHNNFKKNTVFLRSLIKDNLKEFRLSIIIYDDIDNYINLDEVLQEAYQICTSVLITKSEQIEHSIQKSPSHFFRGPLIKTLLITFFRKFIFYIDMEPRLFNFIFLGYRFRK